MRQEHLYLLRCPETGKPLQFKQILKESQGRIQEGILVEPDSGQEYPIVNHIPRFVSEKGNYTSNFGLEWNIHSRTQYDDTSHFQISSKRFKEETRWGNGLEAEHILEVGSGSGRFTVHAAETDAMVVSLDYSNAVEANWRSNGHRDNVLIVQASVYEMPFIENFFEKAFCFGVLQHTPDPEAAFLAIVKHLKPGGKIASDVYRKSLTRWLLQTKYYIRPFVKNTDPQVLYRWTRRYIDWMWPIAKLVRKIPGIGYAINWRLLVADYSKELPGASEEVLKEWAYLDTFDMLSPQYDLPQTLRTFRRWHQKAGLKDIDVHYGYNGIEGRGTKT